MRNAGLGESQAGIKIARRNIFNLRYADDTNNGREQRGTKEPLDEGQKGQWKKWLTFERSKNEDHGIQSNDVTALRDFMFGGFKITADSDCRHEIKRCLFLGRKAMTNLDSVLKSRHITLPTKVYVIKAKFFPVVMYGCESWTIKKAEWWRNHAFELWCWRRLLRVPWTARRSNQSILKEIGPEFHWKNW